MFPSRTSTSTLFDVNFFAPVSRSKSHSTSTFAEGCSRSREISGEISRGSVRNAIPERFNVVSKILRRLVITAPPNFGSKKYFCVSRQLIHSRLPQLFASAVRSLWSTLPVVSASVVAHGLLLFTGRTNNRCVTPYSSSFVLLTT